MRIQDIAYPRQVILLTARAELEQKFSSDKQLKDNIMTLSWHMPVSFDPPLYAVAVGKQRYTLKMLRHSRAFAVNFMPYSSKDDAIFCGRNSGETIDKFKEISLEKQEAETIDCPILKQALAYAECEVVNEVEAGDHIIIIGKILKMHENKKGKRLFQSAGGDNFTTTK